MQQYKYTIILLLAFICYSPSLLAQRLNGMVYELESSNPLWNVTIKNLRTSQEVLSDRYGSFQLDVQINDYLTVSSAGYQTDTVFVYEIGGVRRIYMVRDEKSILIDEVVVRRLTDSRLALEIAKAENEGKAVDVSQQRGGLRVSPSRLFGRKAKNARSNLEILIEEQNNRKVDQKFTIQLITSLTPLSTEEIALFRERFRPSLAFVQLASPEELRLYILDSYKKFKEDN